MPRPFHSVDMADKVDPTTNHNDRWDGPKKKYWHVVSSFNG